MTRFSNPEVDGAIVPTHPQPLTFSEYSMGTGPVSQLLQKKGLHHPVRLARVQLHPTEGLCASPNLDNHRFVVCSNTGRVYGRSVSPTYNLAQNTTIANMLDQVILPGTTPKIMSFQHGARVGFEIPISNEQLELSDEDKQMIRDARKRFNVGVHGWQDKDEYTAPYDASLLITNTHGGSGALTATLKMKFLACDNGLVQPIKKGGFAFRHNARLDERFEQMRTAFELAQSSVKEQSYLIRRMFATPMNATEFTEFIERVYPATKGVKKDTQRKKKLQNLENHYYRAPGAEPGTVFGALQAVTYYNSHQSRISRSKYKLDIPEDQLRQESYLYGAGAQKNAQAFNYCLDMMN